MDVLRYLRAVTSFCTVVSVLACLSGCQSAPWPFGSLATNPEEPVAAPNEPEQPAALASDAPKQDAAEKPSAPNIPPGLSDHRWIMNVRSMTPGIDEPKSRWHHPTLDSLIATAPARRPDLLPLLTNPNAIIANNAAIVIGRWKSDASVEKLSTAVNDINSALPLRQAAIETLGMISSDEAKRAIEEMLAIADEPSTGETRLTDVPDIFAELLASRAKHIDVSTDRRFISALKHPSKLVRLEAASAWARTRTPALEATPIELLDSINDSDIRVRVAALRAVAVNRPPQAAEYLTRATRDFDVTVRLAAIACLGELGSKEAKTTLDKLRKDPSEISRAAVVGALAVLGADEAVLAAASDKSPKVRQAVADSLKDFKSETKQVAHDAELLAHQLVQDASTDVQRRTIESLQTWPLEQAGPVLLVAIEEGTYSARKQAAVQLGERWAPAKDFYCDAPKERFAEQIAALKKAWRQEFGALDRMVVRTAATEIIRATGLSETQLELLEKQLAHLSDPSLPDELRQQAIDALTKLGPALVETLELWTEEELQHLPPSVYTLVLPELSPLFSSLARMASTDTRERRAAASELATQLKGKRLSALLLHRLSQVVKAENDAIVWQTVLAAVASDPSQVASQLAYMAIGHASSEVRRRACEYLQTHSDTCHLQALLPVLEDPNVTVAIAAVRAIGAAGVGDPEPLVRLLNVPDKQLRLETAMALARSKIEAGFAGIERLSRDTDFEIRRAAAVAMGEVGDEVFVPALIILIEDRRDIQVAALSSLAKIAGHDVVQEDELSVLPDEQVRRWKRWYSDKTPASEKGEDSESSHSVEIEPGR